MTYVYVNKLDDEHKKTNRNKYSVSLRKESENLKKKIIFTMKTTLGLRLPKTNSMSIQWLSQLKYKMTMHNSKWEHLPGMIIKQSRQDEADLEEEARIVVEARIPAVETLKSLGLTRPDRQAVLHKEANAIVDSKYDAEKQKIAKQKNQDKNDQILGWIIGALNSKKKTKPEPVKPLDVLVSEILGAKSNLAKYSTEAVDKGHLWLTTALRRFKKLDNAYDTRLGCTNSWCIWKKALKMQRTNKNR